MEENEERTLYENLEYLNETKGIIKQAIIDKGVEVSADTPFREYADKIGDIQGGSGDLDDVITAQEQYIEELEAIIDEKASGGGSGDGTTMNIFVQTTEPSIKKGLWLQIDKTMEHIDSQDNILVAGEWQPSSYTSPIKLMGSRNDMVTVGTDIYYQNWVQGGTSTLYKYDTVNHTNSFVTNLTKGYANNIIVVGNYIYGFDTGNSTNHGCYKYDIANNTFTDIASMSYAFYTSGICYYDGEIYLVGGTTDGTYKNFYKYNLENDSYIKLDNLPVEFFRGSVSLVGSKIYIIGGTQNNRYKIYSYNIKTNAFNLEVSNTPDLYDQMSVSVANNIFILGGQGLVNSGSGAIMNRTLYNYNTITNEITLLPNAPGDLRYGSATVVGNAIYTACYATTAGVDPTQLWVYAFDDFVTENNSVVISQGRAYKVGYNTELFSNSLCINPMICSIADAWFYTTEDGVITDIPTYYGDGTQWVKFKN